MPAILGSSPLLFISCFIGAACAWRTTAVECVAKEHLASAKKRTQNPHSKPPKLAIPRIRCVYVWLYPNCLRASFLSAAQELFEPPPRAVLPLKPLSLSLGPPSAFFAVSDERSARHGPPSPERRPTPPCQHAERPACCCCRALFFSSVVVRTSPPAPVSTPTGTSPLRFFAENDLLVFGRLVKQ
jgi:hypothetical protein